MSVSIGTTINECLSPNFTFPESIAFTASLRSRAAFTNTFILTYSLSHTQTMSICNPTLLVSCSISALISNCLISARSRCVLGLQQLLYQCFRCLLRSSSKATIEHCCVRCLLSYCLGSEADSNRMKNRKQRILEAANSFSEGLLVSHIEEDPFADDFKEVNSLIKCDFWSIHCVKLIEYGIVECKNISKR